MLAILEALNPANHIFNTQDSLAQKFVPPGFCNKGLQVYVRPFLQATPFVTMKIGLPGSLTQVIPSTELAWPIPCAVVFPKDPKGSPFDPE